MSWTPAALSIALRYEYVFQPLEYFHPGIKISDRYAPTLEKACAWLHRYNLLHPGSEIQIVDVSVINGELCISVFPDVELVDLEMMRIRQKSASFD